MALAFAHYDTGATVRGVIYDDSDQYADVVAEAMESFNAADVDDYDITATEVGNTGKYKLTWPSWLSAGLYVLEWLPLAGGAIAESDFPNRFATQSYYWDGADLRPALAVHTAAILDDTAEIGVAGAGLTALAQAADLAAAVVLINAILLDTDELQTDWTDGGRLDLLLDSIVLVGGAGASSQKITCKVGGNPIDGVEVWVTTDAAGYNVAAGTLSTDASGEVTFMLDPGDYYVWRQKAGYNFTNPQEITVT
jgi:hypothetical protein